MQIGQEVKGEINPLHRAFDGSDRNFAIALACRYMKLTPAQAIAAATINAAAAIGRHDRLGSIEPGKQADLIVLDADDYRQLGYQFGVNLVSHIIKKGQIYSNPVWN